jgi:hypothetical protein
MRLFAHLFEHAGHGGRAGDFAELGRQVHTQLNRALAALAPRAAASPTV